MELTEFLLARITEDEDYVRRVGSITGMMLGAHLPGSPTRVLAECEAKRQIVNLRPEGLAPESPGSMADWAYGWTLRLLAMPYADHPDFEEGWQF